MLNRFFRCFFQTTRQDNYIVLPSLPLVALCIGKTIPLSYCHVLCLTILDLGKTILNCLTETILFFVLLCHLYIQSLRQSSKLQFILSCSRLHLLHCYIHVYIHILASICTGFSSFDQKLAGILDFQAFTLAGYLIFSVYNRTSAGFLVKSRTDFVGFCVGRSTLCSEVIHTLLLFISWNSVLIHLELGFLVQFGDNWI